MIKILVVTLFSLLIIPLIKTKAQTPLYDKNWTLIPSKSDEFNTTVLGSRWNKISGDHWGESIFDVNYVILDGSKLRLKINKIGDKYYTGGIETKTFDYQYGYFEIEAILPYGKGLWPCFWLWGANGVYSYTEIDILEPAGCQFQYADRNVFGFWYKPLQNVPCSASPNSPDYIPNCDVKVEFDRNNISNMSLYSHKYAVEWYPSHIIFYLDDVPMGSACNDSRVPFDPTCVIIDLQVDGGSCSPNDQTLVPQFMDINYFRYYTLKKDCGSSINIVSNNFDFSNPSNFAVKKSYMISNSSLPNGQNITLRATDFIELGNDFFVPANTQFNAIITNCY